MRLTTGGRALLAAILITCSFGTAALVAPKDAGAASFPHMVTSAAPNPAGTGYWDVYQDGTVTAQGGTTNYGSMAGRSLNAPMINIAATSSGGGYWLLGADGGIFSFGNAHFYGSEGGQRLNRPVVGLASTANSGGYWEVAADGGIFSFGNARFHGSTGSLRLNAPIVGMAVTPDGGGYWLVAADGGIFSFGDAAFYGSTGSLHLNAPVVGMATTPDGRGYWLVASDGGIFSFGDAHFYGSDPGRGISIPASGMVPSGNGGYTVILSNGQVVTFSPPNYQTVSLLTLCAASAPGDCHQGTVQVGSSLFTYVDYQGYSDGYPTFDTLLEILPSTCRSLTLDFAAVPSIAYVEPGDTGYLQLVQGSGTQGASAPVNSVGTLQATLDGGPADINVTATADDLIYINGSAQCLTPSGR